MTESQVTTGMTQPGKNPQATDAARRMAAENDVDLNLIDGTGEDGRIVVDDVQAVLDAEPEAPAASKITLLEAQDAHASALGYLGFAQATNDSRLIDAANEQLEEASADLEQAEKENA